MKKNYIQKMGISLSVMCLLSLNVYGQNDTDINNNKNIDWKEDSAEIVTIQDIVKTQQEITVSNSMEDHFRDVWSRKDYINISYNSSTLSPDDNIPLGLREDKPVPSYSSDWGVSLQVGNSSRLHKRPIANTLQFYFDFSYVDLNVNHYKTNGTQGIYDTSIPNIIDNKNFFNVPWNMEKYEINYGMAVGPSVTVAPFNSLNNRNLHYIKFNMFYHIGYNASLIYMLKDKDFPILDANPATDPDQSLWNRDLVKVRDNAKLLWGHGLISSFGFSVSWKFIGLGYEHRVATVKYKPIDTDTYGDSKYKFKTSTSRIFLQFRI